MGNCQSCGAELLPDAKFCHECGTPVARPSFDCPTCHTTNPVGARFCTGCGQAFLPVDTPAVATPPDPAPTSGFESEPLIDFTDEPETDFRYGEATNDEEVYFEETDEEIMPSEESDREVQFVEIAGEINDSGEDDPEDPVEEVDFMEANEEVSNSEEDDPGEEKADFLETENRITDPWEDRQQSEEDFWDSLVETREQTADDRERPKNTYDVEFEWTTGAAGGEEAEEKMVGEVIEQEQPDLVEEIESVETEEVPPEPDEENAPPPEPNTPNEVAETITESPTGLVRNEPPDLEPPPTLRKLQVAFGEMFEWRVRELSPKLDRYRERAVDSGFLETVEQRFPQILADSIPLDPSERRRFIERTFAELMDYFLAAHCADLNPIDLPAAVMRYQGVPVTADNLFRVVYDYLELDREREPFYVDFVKMPTKKLRRAAKSFLFAQPDERILLILDQTLLGSVKEGFAFTDRALYWKPHLEPAASVALIDLQELKRQHDWLRINGKFFHVSRPVNLKMLYLLRKIKRDGIGGNRS